MATLARLSLLVAGAAAADARPNIVFILADDLNADWKNDRLGYMPHLRKRFSEQGAFFENHMAAVPVCGPSRSSLLAGRYPHNAGYLINDDLDSIDAFCGSGAAQGANNTVGRWLRDAGYHTAFLGKYVNSCEHYVPYGWSHWGGFIQTYNFYNATMYDMDWEDDGAEPEIKTRGMEGVHQADFLGTMTLAHAKKAVSQGKPFFVHVTPVMPHWGTCYGPGAYGPLDPHWEMAGVKDEDGKTYSLPISPCPTDRHRHAFDDQSNPHIDGVWNVSIGGLRPKFMTGVEKNGVNAFQSWREDLGWQNRSASLLDLDDMIGEIIDGLEEMDVLDNTYVFFSSDNGYHLGEHKNVMGKGLPYETDVRLPMYVLGPTVKPNTTMNHPTTHLDITATIAELAGVAPVQSGNQLDGKSFAQELGGGDADAWRQFSFGEMFMNAATWHYVRQVNSTHKFSHARWCHEEHVEIFDLRSDPWQTSNLAGQAGLPELISKQFDPISTTLASCAGASCSSPVPSLGAEHDFDCYYGIQGKEALQGSFSFQTGAHHKAIAINGWALDFNKDGRGTSHPRGFSPLEVRLRMDGKFVQGFQQIANITRPDLNKSTGIFARFPNLEHGFHFDLWPGLPDEAFIGRHQFDVMQVVRDPKTQKITNTKVISQPQKVQCLYDGKPGACEGLMV